MSLIDENRIIKWAKESNLKVPFPEIDQRLTSYYSAFDNMNTSSNLDFKTVSELKEELEKIWDTNSKFHTICMLCACIAFRNKPDIEFSQDKEQYAISDYIYIF